MFASANGGAIDIDAKGDIVTSTAGSHGINAQNNGNVTTDIDLTGSITTGNTGAHGILASGVGSAANVITISGAISANGASSRGISMTGASNTATVAAGGSVAGTAAGIFSAGATTITNRGTIEGLGGALAIQFLGSDTHNVRLDTGSVLVGNAQGGTGTDNLALLGTGTESIAKFLSFETLSMQGADWTATGTGTFATSAEVQSGVLRVNGELTTPTFTVQAGGTLGGTGTIIGDVVQRRYRRAGQLDRHPGRNRPVHPQFGDL